MYTSYTERLEMVKSTRRAESVIIDLFYSSSCRMQLINVTGKFATEKRLMCCVKLGLMYTRVDE